LELPKSMNAVAPVTLTVHLITQNVEMVTVSVHLVTLNVTVD